MLRRELLIQRLRPLPRNAVDCSHLMRVGATGVHFRSVVGPENDRCIKRVIDAIGSGPYQIIAELPEYGHVMLRNDGDQKQLAPVHLLLPEAVNKETDLSLSHTRFGPEDDLSEYCANNVLVRLKAQRGGGT